MGRRFIDLKTISGKGIKSFAFLKPSLYATVYLADGGGGGRLPDQKQKKQRTPADGTGGENPEWDHPIRIVLESQDQGLLLQFDIMAQAFLGDRLVGRVRVPVADLSPENPAGAFCPASYLVQNSDGKPNGVLSFLYKMSGDEGRILRLASAIGNSPPKMENSPPSTTTTSYYPPPPASAAGNSPPKMEYCPPLATTSSYYPPPPASAAGNSPPGMEYCPPSATTTSYYPPPPAPAPALFGYLPVPDPAIYYPPPPEAAIYYPPPEPAIYYPPPPPDPAIYHPQPPADPGYFPRPYPANGYPEAPAGGLYPPVSPVHVACYPSQERHVYRMEGYHQETYRCY